MVYIAKNTDEEIKEKEKLSGPQNMPHETRHEDRLQLNQLSPKNAVVIGLVGSVMTICTIGFAVLIWLVFR